MPEAIPSLAILWGFSMHPQTGCGVAAVSSPAVAPEAKLGNFSMQEVFLCLGHGDIG